MGDIEPLEKPLDRKSLESATTAYFSVHNMRCEHCAHWVRNGLLKREGVLLVDVFYRQGIAAATYDPALISTHDLLQAITQAGQAICHNYGAEFIGQEPAIRALHLQ